MSKLFNALFDRFLGGRLVKLLLIDDDDIIVVTEVNAVHDKG